MLQMIAEDLLWCFFVAKNVDDVTNLRHGSMLSTKCYCMVQ